MANAKLLLICYLVCQKNDHEILKYVRGASNVILWNINSSHLIMSV